MSRDVFGEAIEDYFNTKSADTLWLHNSYGEPEEMPVDWFFRKESEMPDVELYALDLCRGNVLDVGAGVGSHTLALQQNFDIAALEISEKACEIMRKRGIKKVLKEDIFSFSGERFETLLMLMNGIGVCGDMQVFRGFLAHARSLLKPGGQILFDSSDISYLYEDGQKPRHHYFGEISYRYEYKNHSGEWFKWLYIDTGKLMETLKNESWDGQIIYESGDDHYLARIWPV